MEKKLRSIRHAISGALVKDRHLLKRALHKIQSDYKRGRDISAALITLTQRIEQSQAKCQARAASVPVLNYPDLPVANKHEEIATAIRNHQVVIVCGETGSGKTTQLPKIALSVGRGVGGMIGHTQPRRIAARSVAERIAEELGESIGQSVGYKIRFHDQSRQQGLIKLMTDGILLAEVQSDPYLNHYDTLIIDEAHERSLNIDFLLGYLKWLLPKRPDLKVIITSATIDPERFAKHYNDAPIIEVSGRTYPVEIRYRPIQTAEEEDETSRDLQQAIVEAVDELHRESGGDILIFLTGERDIRETAESLRKHHPVGCEILPLYSSLSAGEQMRIFKPHNKRRIILATNVAETSLTVPGIRCVIDTGHARISRYSHRSKLQRLPIEKVSQASANQRAGRCGRVADGICIRLYARDDYEARPEFTQPEILRTNLAAVILQMTTMKLGDIARFPFVEPPDERMIRDGLKTLEELNAINADQQLTEVGRRLSRLPIDPKLGRMLLAAEQELCLDEVAIIVSALSVQDPRERPMEKAPAADQKHAKYKVDGSDFLAFLKLWRHFQQQKKALSNNQLRRHCRDNFLSYLRMREWQEIHQQIMQVIKGELSMKPNQTEADIDAIHRALLSGLLSNIGFKQETEYLGARGLKFHIFPGSNLFKVKPKWIVAAEQVETSKIYGRIVAKIDPEWVERAAQHLIKRTHYEPHWERKPARVGVFERVELYGLVLQSGRRIPYEKVDPVAAREIFIRSALVNQDYHTNAPFFRHNQQLLEEAGYLQHKGRRVDLMVDEAGLFQFYDSLIPAEVVNGVTFDQWRKVDQKREPKRLFLTSQDVTQMEASDINPENYPDQFEVDQLVVPLTYRFEPGHVEDGMTVTVPLHQLAQLSAEPFEWLAPGLLREKVIALIKSLPKTRRKHFVPAPDFADRALKRLKFGEGSLKRSLAEVLHALSGVKLQEDEWNEAQLADHLRISFRLVDESDQVVECGKDLAALKKRFARQAGVAFEQLAERNASHSGSTDWQFGELSERCEQSGSGGSFIGFPAIIDEGDTVGLRVVGTEQEARVLHRRGLIRLFSLTLRREISYLRKNLQLTAADQLSYNRLPSHPFLYNKLSGNREQCRDEMVGLIIATLFIDDQPPIRNEQLFRQRLKKLASELLPTANRVGRTVVATLKAYRAIQQGMAKLPDGDPLIDDLTEQLERMIYRGFLAATPYRQIEAMPRYLEAASNRFLVNGYQRDKDQPKLQQLQPFWRCYWSGVIEQGDALVVMPEDDPFRWQLEEFRVSLFAQKLKTAGPISAKRLEKAWAERR